MKWSVDSYVRLMEDIFLAGVIFVEWIVIPVPIIVGVDPLYTCLDDRITAR